MARIPYFDMSGASDAYKKMLGQRRPLNLYRMLPHAGPAAEGFLRLVGSLLRENELDPVLREVAILRVGMLSNASYEVHQHKRVARSVGMSDEKIAALEPDADPQALNEREKFVLDFTDQLVRHVKAPDQMFNRACELFGYRPISELVLTIGFYMMVCRFLENFEVDIEPPGTIV